MSLDMFLQHCFNALTLGSLYALIAIGYTMVYGILRLINFAHGDILMIGAYFVFFGTFAFGWPWGVAAVVAVLGASVLGILVERIAYRPLRDAPRISALISAIAVSFFIESLAVVVFTGQPRPVLQPEWLVSEWQLGGVRILPLTAFVPAMLDEPSLGLAPLLVREIFSIVKRINEEGKTVLLVEQNAFAALSVAHYAYILEVGRVVLEGPGSELLENPKVKEAYLGG